MKVSFLFCCMVWLLAGFSPVFAQKEKIRALRPLEQCTPVTDMGDQIDSVEWIPLRFSDGTPLEFLRKLLVLPDGRFLIHNLKDVACFSAQGKYLFSMGQACTPEKGCGLIHDICLSADRKYLYLAGRDDMVTCFDLKDGKELKTVSLKDRTKASVYYDIAPAPEGGFYLYTPFRNDEDGFFTGYKLLTQFDREGRELGRFIERPDYTLPGFMISQAQGNRYFVRVQGGDNACYEIKNGELRKYCTVDFGDKGIPALYMYTANGGHVGDIQSYMRADYFKMPIFFSETAEYFYFAACASGAKTFYYLYPRTGERGISWEGDRDGIVIRFWAADDDYFYVLLEDGLQDYNGQTNDPLLREVMTRIGVVAKDKLKGSQLLKIKFKSY